MSPKKRKVVAAYTFFRQAELEKRVITIDEVVDVTGWSKSTANTYRTKYWHFFLEKEGYGFRCTGLAKLTEDAFLRLHKQRHDLSTDILRPRFTLSVDSLIDKSRESALLAIQVYNNPLVAFRTPGYVVHMIIAFTSLFHAIFERNGTEYWHVSKDGSVKTVDGDRKSWELAKCVNEYYGGRSLPEAENLRFFIAIRNKIEHRYIPELDITFAGKCQALLMNFEELLTSEFGRYFSLVPNLFLALQFSTYSVEQQPVLKSVQKKAFNEVRRYSELHDAGLPEEVVQSPRYSFRVFLIPRIGSHAKSADVAIEFVHYDPSNPTEMEKYEKQVALIKEKTIAVLNKGNLKPTKVAELVQERTGRKFSPSFHHANAWRLYEVRSTTKSPSGCKTEYCQFDEAFQEYVYTQQWVDFLCEKVSDDAEYRRNLMCDL